MYKMYLKNPEEIGSMRGYLDISQEQITYAVNKFTKFFVPISLWVCRHFSFITIYVADYYSDDECYWRYLGGSMKNNKAGFTLI